MRGTACPKSQQAKAALRATACPTVQSERFTCVKPLRTLQVEKPSSANSQNNCVVLTYNDTKARRASNHKASHATNQTVQIEQAMQPIAILEQDHTFMQHK